MHVLTCPKGIFSSFANSLSRCFACSIHYTYKSSLSKQALLSRVNIIKKSHNWGHSFWKRLVCHIRLILQQDRKSIRKGGCMEYSLDSVLIWPYLCVRTLLVIVKWSSQSLANSSYHHIHNSGHRSLWFKFPFMLTCSITEQRKFTPKRTTQKTNFQNLHL